MVVLVLWFTFDCESKNAERRGHTGFGWKIRGQGDEWWT